MADVLGSIKNLCMEGLNEDRLLQPLLQSYLLPRIQLGVEFSSGSGYCFY